MRVDQAISQMATGTVDLAKIRKGLNQPLDLKQVLEDIRTTQGASELAVGQRAKIAAAQAIEAGAVLPRNAQGLAAARIAQGADPSTVFAALIVPADPPPAPGGEETGTGVTGGVMQPAAEDPARPVVEDIRPAEDVTGPEAVIEEQEPYLRGDDSPVIEEQVPYSLADGSADGSGDPDGPVIETQGPIGSAEAAVLLLSTRSESG